MVDTKHLPGIVRVRFRIAFCTVHYCSKHAIADTKTLEIRVRFSIAFCTVHY